MSKVITVYHSQYGHTKLQAEAVHQGVKEVIGEGAVLMTVEEAGPRLDEFDSADGIVFGCPTYMGSVSAGMKVFMEAAGKKWYVQAWKDKVGGAFTSSGSYSGDKMNTLVGLVINAMQHGMIYVGLGLLPSASSPESRKKPTGPSPEVTNRVGAFIGPMATSLDIPAGESPSTGDLETARLYGKRVAEIAVRLAKTKA